MKRYQAHILLLIMALIYSGNFPIAKSLFELHLNISSSELVLIRVIFAAVCFIILETFFVNREARSKVKLKDFILPALMLAIGSQLLFFWGLKLTSSTSASIMRLSTPISVFIIAYYIGQEKFKKKRMYGILVGTLGALVTIIGPILERSYLDLMSFSNWKGDILVLLSAIAFGYYTILAKKLIRQGYRAVSILKWSFVIGAVSLIYVYAILGMMPLGFDQFSFFDIQWRLFELNDWAALSYFLVGATFFTFLINISVLQKLDASTVSFYTLLLPLFTGIIVVCFFEETVSLSMVIGGILILLGIIWIYGIQIVLNPIKSILKDFLCSKK